MITNGLVLGALATFALLGSISVLELVVWLCYRLLAIRKPMLASRLAIGADAGFNFQLATSVWFSWFRITRSARHNYLPGTKPNGHYGSLIAMTLVSASFVVLVLLLEVAIIEAGQPTVRRDFLSSSKLNTFAVGGSEESRGNFSIRDDALMINQSEFSGTVSIRYVSTARIQMVSLSPQLATKFEKTTKRNYPVSIWACWTIDGKNEDGTDFDRVSGHRKTANLFTVHIGQYDTEFFSVYAERSIETLNRPRMSLFTDFSEIQSKVFQQEMFKALGLKCKKKNMKLRANGSYRAIEYDCKLTKRLGIPGRGGLATKNAIDKARLKIAKRIFTVRQYSQEWLSHFDENEGRATRGEDAEGLIGMEVGVRPSGVKFILLCVAAALGVARIVSGTLVDYRRISEDFLLRASPSGGCLDGPGNWDGDHRRGWRVYKLRDRGGFGYSNQEVSDDVEIPHYARPPAATDGT